MQKLVTRFKQIPRWVWGVMVLVTSASSLLALHNSAVSATPIKHVVIIYQENHTFDNVLGKLCVADHRCNGTTTGKIHTGATIKLKPATDIVPTVDHNTSTQRAAINGGAMNGFDLIGGCEPLKQYPCYSQFLPEQIPNLAALARAYALSDSTFATNAVPSWGAHLELATGTLGGFSGDNPGKPKATTPPLGWGCDSGLEATWHDAQGPWLRVPSCVPAPDGSGPFRPSPVPWMPTIMDYLSSANRTWKIYAGNGDATLAGGYGWAICPTFAECLYGQPKSNLVPNAEVVADAAEGELPSVSFVMPTGQTSQHNLSSMVNGDNYIGTVVNAIMHGPDWANTLVFITYDDCGCFYDHVAPPAGSGLRVPMVIVSPYAKPHFTDSQTATANSMLAFITHNFGLPTLPNFDPNTYDYMNSLDFAQKPLPAIKLKQLAPSAATTEWLKAHPNDLEDDLEENGT